MLYKSKGIYKTTSIYKYAGIGAGIYKEGSIGLEYIYRDIFGQTYKFLKLDTLYFMCGVLNYAGSGINPVTHNGIKYYPFGDANTVKNRLPAGFKFPSSSELISIRTTLNSLKAILFSSYTRKEALLDNLFWANGGGLNLFQLNFSSTGYWQVQDGFLGDDVTCAFWTDTLTDCAEVTNDGWITSWAWPTGAYWDIGRNAGLPVRLVYYE